MYCSCIFLDGILVNENLFLPSKHYLIWILYLE
jgi:hypothetical protein